MRTLLFLHLLGAAIWVGGHLVLALGILPGALRRRDPQAIRAFEQVYERIGIPALLLQVVSGLWLASLWLPFDHWFGATPVAVPCNSSCCSWRRPPPWACMRACA